MNNSNTTNVEGSNCHVNDNAYQNRRRLEMKRRFGILQSRRSHLERELEAVKNSLISLDHQMKSYASYEQLLMHK